MQVRTIEDLYDKEIGSKWFAVFVSIAQFNGYKISNVKEYYEKFVFDFNGEKADFDKHIKGKKNVEKYFAFVEKWYEMAKTFKVLEEE